MEPFTWFQCNFINYGHTLPAIHYLLTAKIQGLYRAVSENIRVHIHQLIPTASMSDWEPEARNTFREVLPKVTNYGCWFHYTQRVWAKTPNLGLSHGFKNNPEIARFIRQLMSIPFSPASLLYPTYPLKRTPTLKDPEAVKLTKLKNYVRKHWLVQIPPRIVCI